MTTPPEPANLGERTDNRRGNTVLARNRQRPTPHLYLALGGLVASGVTCVLNVWAYYNEGAVLTHIGFAAATVTAAVLFLTWFWGIFLAINGAVPRGRIPFLVVHVTAGSVLPLIYVLHVGFQIGTLGSQPISGLETSLDIAGFALVAAQVAGGVIILTRRFPRRG